MIKKNNIVYCENIFIKVSLFCFIILIFGSCKTSKITIIDNSRNLETKEKNEVLTDVLNSSLRYKTLSAKTSLELIGSQSSRGLKTNCYVKLICDKELQLSVRIPFINSEAFRLNLTPDSVLIIDRLGKKYAVESLKELTKKRDIVFNYYNVQSLLTNGLFVSGNNEVDKKDFKDFFLSKEADLYNLIIKDRQQTVSNFKINASDRIQETIITNSEYNFATTWQYSDFVKNLNGDIYPTTLQAKVKINNKSVGVNITYNELDLNSDVTIDNQIPKKYQKCSIGDILEAYLK